MRFKTLAEVAFLNLRSEGVGTLRAMRQATAALEPVAGVAFVSAALSVTAPADLVAS